MNGADATRAGRAAGDCAGGDVPAAAPLLLAREFPAMPAALAGIRAAAQAAFAAAGCDGQTTADWVLAVNEACMNVIAHAYGDSSDDAGRVLRIEIGRDGDEVFATICDRGAPTTLADLQPRPFDELRPGGLGVHFMRAVTDTMAYLPPGDGWHNRLRLGRRLQRLR